MYIQLEQQDYNEIAYLVSSADDTRNGYVMYEDLIEVNFSKSIEGKVDDDYYNGTGEWTTTDVDFELKEILAPCEVRCDRSELKKTIEKKLWE